MHQSFVTTALPPTGKGRDDDFSFQCPAISHTLRGRNGGQIFALCPALHNRKSARGKDANVKTLSFSHFPRGRTGGQIFALCPALHNKKSAWGKDANVKTLSFPTHCRYTRKVTTPPFSPATHFPVGRGEGAQLF